MNKKQRVWEDFATIFAHDCRKWTRSKKETNCNVGEVGGFCYLLHHWIKCAPFTQFCTERTQRYLYLLVVFFSSLALYAPKHVSWCSSKKCAWMPCGLRAFGGSTWCSGFRLAETMSECKLIKYNQITSGEIGWNRVKSGGNGWNRIKSGEIAWNLVPKRKF